MIFSYYKLLAFERTFFCIPTPVLVMEVKSDYVKLQLPFSMVFKINTSKVISRAILHRARSFDLTHIAK